MINYSINKYNDMFLIYWDISDQAKHIRFLTESGENIYVYSSSSGYLNNNIINEPNGNLKVVTDYCNKIHVFLDNNFKEFQLPVIEKLKEVQKQEIYNNFKCILSKNNELLSINFVKKEHRQALFSISTDLSSHNKNDFFFKYDPSKDDYTVPLTVLPKGKLMCCLMNKNKFIDNLYNKTLISNIINN